MSHRNIVVVVGLASLLGGCGEAAPMPPGPPPQPSILVPPTPPGPAPAGTTPDAEFRKAVPAPGPDVVFVPPNIQEARLSNGVRVLLVERHELPIVAVQIVADRGADQSSPGVGGFVGGMLLAGTKTRPALQLSDELERLGASYGAGVDFDGSVVRGQCLSPKLASMLTILADVVQNPAFAKDEIERERSRRLTALAQENDRPANLLANTVSSTLYPAGHPYASTLLGDEAALKKTSQADLVRFHAATFLPDHTTVAVAGDITKDKAVAEIERALGAWKGKAPKAAPVAEPPAVGAKDPRVVLVDRPGATQSNVSVALPGVPRSTKDFDAILVMNTILGGQFSSRLNMNLREAHAYTYGARSGFDFRHGPGPFTAGGAIFAAKTDAAVKEILTEVDRIRRDPVSEEELADAKASLIKQLPARFETAGETAGTLAGLAIYGLPLDEFATRPARFAKVTRDDVKRVAEAYLKPERIRVVVVGDLAVIKEGLGSVGLGAPVIKTPPGKPAETKKPTDGSKKPDEPKKPGEGQAKTPNVTPNAKP